jgi:hypothetical protein
VTAVKTVLCSQLSGSAPPGEKLETIETGRGPEASLDGALDASLAA